jgi:hypothetical protein
MPKDYSAAYRSRVGSTAGEEPVYLLEITHPQLGAPVRIVRDTQDLVSNGHTYIAMAFDIQLPDDLSQSLPRAPIRIDNVGRELTQWIDASGGGRGAQVRLMQVMRSDPDTIEYDVMLDLIEVRQNGAHIVGELGYEDTLNVPALGETYRPDNTPGLF